MVGLFRAGATRLGLFLSPFCMGFAMTEVERIHDQLERAFEGDAWHGPALLEVLDGVSAEQAQARPLSGAHNIWELVMHIAVWEDVVRRRLDGDDTPATADLDWHVKHGSGETAWRETLDRLKHGHQELRKAVSSLTDSRLEEETPGGVSIYRLMHGVVQHDLYHVGQIALLKKAL